MIALRVRMARRHESSVLTRVAHEAKASWGYPRAWLDHWAADLTVAPGYIERHSVLVAELEGTVVGFAALEEGRECMHLAHLWVGPDHHGLGVGRALLRAASEQVAARGGNELEVVSDPNAAPFYERMGGRTVGWVDASFADVHRRLPVLRLPVHGFDRPTTDP